MTGRANITSFADLIDMWPTHEALADDVGVKSNLPPVWKHRNMIPSRHWLAVVASADRRGYELVTLDLLAALAVDETGAAETAVGEAKPGRRRPPAQSPPFSKILIANRGEIACRVMRTAKRLGIATVAVYSEADADALHTRLADEAVLVGPAPSAESYLAVDAIVGAALETGAEAVHPGYGFLAENAAFAEALEEAGITFIGPSADAIRRMGDKVESKRIAREAGVVTVPGHAGVVADAEAALEAARSVGYPVMIKAAAGGGGKGMRVARGDDEVRDGFRAAASEAKSSFADDRVFIEKLIEEPRHIEIQVLADAHGNVVHLGERECSIQRRHQKVIEEAPSPFLDDATRAAMGAQAVALARAVGYRSAGTVEFIADRDRNFYFLEMNTRLQVEHPVTEFVTGLDLVEQMIRIAAGETLAFDQEDVATRGWAIEARVYAEDPFRNFLPSTGRLVRYLAPEQDEALRVEAGVAEGDEISVYYDPMIAKVVTHGPTRDDAIQRMRQALDAFYIRGVSHTISFLAAVMAHPRFLAGRLSTDFIADEYGDGFTGADLPADDLTALIAVAAVVHRRHAEREAMISGQTPAHPARAGEDWVVVLKGGRYPVKVAPAEGGYRVDIDGSFLRVASDWRLAEPLFRGSVGGRELCVQVDRTGIGYRLFHAGAETDVQVLRPRAAELAAKMPVKPPPDLSKYLLSPMPGLLISVAVAVGQEVKAGDELAVVEAMKMENVLRAGRDGVVAELLAAPGDSLAVDQAILEFE